MAVSITLKEVSTMRWIEEYGRVIHSYKGHGNLSDLSTGFNEPVSLLVTQLIDGQIYCETQSKTSRMWEALEGPLEITGRTEYGYSVKITDIMPMRFNTNTKLGVLTIYSAVMGHIEVIKSEGFADHINLTTVFTLINYRFPELHIGDIRFTTQECTLLIERLPEHDSNIKTIRATNNSSITSTLSVRFSDGKLHHEEATRFADQLSWILSLGQGCRVGWIQYEIIADNTIITRFHHQAPSTPSTGPQLIPQRRIEDLENYIAYINHCLNVFEGKEQEWQVSRLIDIYLRAIASKPYIEGEALMYAVTLDVARSIYQKNQGKERLIKAELFQEKRADLKKLVKAALKQVFPQEKAKIIERMTRHLGMMQWYPFHDAVVGMFKEVGLQFTEDEIRWLINERDHLAHTYQFTNAIDVIQISDRIQSYVQKLLLAILQYQGIYYDWSIPPLNDWSNRKRPMILSQNNDIITK